MKKPIGADNLFKAIKNDPKEILAWARSEIREYQKLIKLIQKYATTRNTKRK